MSHPITIVFMGTPDFAVPTLTRLIDDPTFAVRGVVTQPDRQKGRGRKSVPTPVKQAALDADLPVWQPEKARDLAMVATLTELAPDYLVVVAYGQILPLSILSIPHKLPVNLHASLLPRWRGAAPIHRAFLAGDAKAGACAMVMEEGLDTGPTLDCITTPIGDDDTVGSLHDRLASDGAELMAETLKRHYRGEITPTPQPDDGVTYAKKLMPADFVIDFSATAAMVSRQIRGLSPFPGAVTMYGGKRIKPTFAEVTGGSGQPGEILAVDKTGIVVACGEGAVRVQRLKPEGKKEMTAHAYSLGVKVTIGERWVTPE